MTSDLPVWVVASSDAAPRWAAALRDQGVRALPLPWSEIACFEADDPLRVVLSGGMPDALLLTSPNAARCLPGTLPRDVPAACVGPATARAALEAGLEVRWVGSGTGADLARELSATRPGARVLFLRGAEVRPETAAQLLADGATVEDLVVYEARPRTSFEAEVSEAPAPAAFAVGSPLAAGALRRALALAGREDLLRRPAAAMGERAARALQDRGFETSACPEVPSLEGLVEVVDALLHEDPSV